SRQVAGVQLTWHSLLPAILVTSFPCPPVFGTGLSVKDSFSGNCDVLFIFCVDKGRIIHQFHSLKRSMNERIEIIRICTEKYFGTFHEMKVYVIFEMNRTREKLPCRNDHPSTAIFGAGENRFSDAFRRECFSICYSTI